MKRLGWGLGSIALIWTLYLLRANVWFRLYPVLIVAFVLATFTISLFRRPLVEVFAARMGATLDEPTKLYCLKVTRIWVVFLTLHLLVTIATLFAPLRIWAVYNGLLAYILMGALFLGEWIYRRYWKRHPFLLGEGGGDAQPSHPEMRIPPTPRCASPLPRDAHPQDKRSASFIQKKRIFSSKEAHLLFRTSGTSGTAKEICRTEASLMADAAALVKEFPEVWGNKAAAVVSSVRPEHMYGALWRERVPKIAAIKVDPAIVTSVEQLLALAATYKHIIFVTTPSFLEKALLHPDFPQLKGSVAEVITSGSLLREGTAAAVSAALGIAPLEVFGCTEVGTVAYRRQKESPLWRVYSKVRVTSCPNGLQVESPFAIERPFIMADAIELVDPTHFKLLGRTDRRVKVLEKYVSLPEVETIFESHPLVDRARAVVYGEDVPRLGMLIVPSTKALENLPTSFAAFATQLRNDLREKMADFAFPRRIRFLRQLPTNEQGKTTESAALAALNAWAQEPFVTKWVAYAAELTANLVFPPDLKCFQGHFPAFPILPGVAQLYYIRHFARQVFPDFPEKGVYRRLKFQKIILPNASVVLHIVKSPKGYDCSLTGANGVCASYLVEGDAE